MDSSGRKQERSDLRTYAQDQVRAALTVRTAVFAMPCSSGKPASVAAIMPAPQDAALHVGTLVHDRPLDDLPRWLPRWSRMTSREHIDGQEGMREAGEEAATGPAVDQGQTGSPYDILEPGRDVAEGDMVARKE